MSQGLYSGVPGLAIGVGLYKGAQGLWSGASGFITGDGGQTLSLNFLAGAPLDPRITFTRASTATFVGSNGLIQTAAVDVPRFDYDPANLTAKGLLLEEQRTNLVTYSEQFDNAAWVNSAATVTPNTATAPDGTTTADNVADTSTSAYQFISRATAVAAAATPYTFSLYVKKTTGGTSATLGFNISLSGGTGQSFTPRFNTDTGVWLNNGNATVQVADVGVYWRLYVSVTNNGTNTSLTIAIYPASGTYNSASDTPTATGSATLWGAQLEAGAFATSYIPTVAAQVTRSADIATMTGTNFSSWYNQPASTMLCSFALEGLDPSGGTSVVWKVDDTTVNNQVVLRQGTVIAGVDGVIITAGVNVADSNSFSVTPNAIYNSAFAWETDYAVLAYNGTVFGPDTSLTVPSVTRAVISGGSKWLRSLTYYPQRLPDATLQALTS